MNENAHFKHIFWFIVGLTVFGAFLSIFLIITFKEEAAARLADQLLIFWLSTAVGGGIGYLIGASASKPSNKTTSSAGNVTADIQATVTSTPAVAEESKEEKSK